MNVLTGARPELGRWVFIARKKRDYKQLRPLDAVWNASCF
jgi:hypothetical protein